MGGETDEAVRTLEHLVVMLSSGAEEHTFERDVAEHYAEAIRAVLAEVADCKRDHPPEPWASELEQRAGQAEADLAQAREEIERLKAWVSDLQAGVYINCVYCGHRYGPDDEVPAAMADVLKAHIEKCPKHPLSHAVARIDAALAEADRSKATREAMNKFQCPTCKRTFYRTFGGVLHVPGRKGEPCKSM